MVSIISLLACPTLYDQCSSPQFPADAFISIYFSFHMFQLLYGWVNFFPCLFLCLSCSFVCLCVCLCIVGVSISVSPGSCVPAHTWHQLFTKCSSAKCLTSFPTHSASSSPNSQPASTLTLHQPSTAVLINTLPILQLSCNSPSQHGHPLN